jgi:hypothetical protein
MQEEIELDVKLIIAYTQTAEGFSMIIPENNGIRIDEVTSGHYIYDEALLFDYLRKDFHLIDSVDIFVIDKFDRDLPYIMKCSVNIILSTYDEYKYYHRHKVLSSL